MNFAFEIVTHGQIEDAGLLNRVKAVISGITSKFLIPGISVGIFFENGSTLIMTGGYADIAEGRLISPLDHFRIASVTKTFISTLILTLLDEARLSLDETVSGLLDLPKNIGNIKIRELLNHTSGLFDYFQDEWFQKEILRNPQRVWDPRELLAIGIAHEPYFKPGESYRYSNTNYIILGLLIESITQNRLSYVLKKRILESLGLHNTYLPEKESSLPDTHIHGYVILPESKRYIDYTFLNPSFAWAAGGMVSNIADMCRLALALGKGEMLSKNSRAEMLSFVDNPANGVPFADYGAGVTRIGNFIGHEGEVLGYNTAVYGHLKGKISIAVVINRSFGKPSVAGEAFVYLAKSVFPGDIPL